MSDSSYFIHGREEDLPSPPLSSIQAQVHQVFVLADTQDGQTRLSSLAKPIYSRRSQKLPTASPKKNRGKRREQPHEGDDPLPKSEARRRGGKVYGGRPPRAAVSKRARVSARREE